MEQETPFSPSALQPASPFSLPLTPFLVCFLPHHPHTTSNPSLGPKTTPAGAAAGHTTRVAANARARAPTRQTSDLAGGRHCAGVPTHHALRLLRKRRVPSLLLGSGIAGGSEAGKPGSGLAAVMILPALWTFCS